MAKKKEDKKKEEKKDEKKEEKNEKEDKKKDEEKKDSKKKKKEDKKDDSSDEKAEIPKKFEKIVKEIEEMSVLDLSELVEVLEDHFGVSAAAPAAVAAAPAAGGGAEEEEKSEFNVVLKEAGGQKINVIKAVRELTGLGLAESKALVDGAPKPVKEGVPKDEADEAKSKLEDAGATVELE